MKISFSQPIYYGYSSKPQYNVTQKVVSDTKQTFTGGAAYYTDLIKKRPVNLGPEITSKYEYKNILNRIYNYKGYDKKPLFDIDYNRAMYPKINPEHEGLLFYAGYADLSDDINRFLSKRELYKMTKPQAKDVVRVLDYSLQKLDEEFGKYSGVVYRQGFFPQGQHQFISATKEPVIAATLRGGIFMNKNLEFSIINTKNGHKITDFQRKMGCEYADEEEEILLSRKSKFKEIIDPKEQYLFLKNKFHKLLEMYARREVDPNKIRIFEEI